MQPTKRCLEGCIGAALFMAGGIAVEGLSNLIGKMDMNHAQKTVEVQPQAPVSATFVVDRCKNCRKPLFVPADRKPHVLGRLCDNKQCDRENTEHYSDERDEEGFY